MLQRLIDDFRESTGTALRLTSLAAAAAVALLVTTSFLCAAAFVFVLQRHGPVEACLAGAAIFFVVALLAAGSYMVRKKQIRARAEQAAREAARTAKSAAQSMLTDPALIAIGIQVVRAIGDQAAGSDSGGRRPGAGILGQPECGGEPSRRKSRRSKCASIAVGTLRRRPGEGRDRP